jgi:hypothetical protein
MQSLAFSSRTEKLQHDSFRSRDTRSICPIFKPGSIEQRVRLFVKGAHAMNFDRREREKPIRRPRGFRAVEMKHLMLYKVIAHRTNPEPFYHRRGIRPSHVPKDGARDQAGEVLRDGDQHLWRSGATSRNRYHAPQDQPIRPNPPDRPRSTESLVSPGNSGCLACACLSQQGYDYRHSFKS